MTCPAWLKNETAPKILVEAVKLYGTKERIGAANNPVIIEWAKECGIKGYTADSIPWCGLFVAVCAKRARKELPDKPLWARDWLNWGNNSQTPMLGDVMVFSRKSGGHVGIYVGEDATAYHVLGGNQSDCVCISRAAKDRFLGARNQYIVKPSNVRRIRLAVNGSLSTNEA